jgi:hypothetical protein
MVTVVTEGIFSYCGVKVKIDTDRYLGAGARRRCAPMARRWATSRPAEYGSQMLSLGGVHHFTGGSKKEGRRHLRRPARALQPATPVELSHRRRRDRSSCRPTSRRSIERHPRTAHARRLRLGGDRHVRRRNGAAMPTRSIVVDDHITGVLTEHQGGKVLGMKPDTGIRVRGRRSTPGRYFQVAEPGLGWGGTAMSDDPLSILESLESTGKQRLARPVGC